MEVGTLDTRTRETTAQRSLVDLLGETRAEIVVHLRDEADASVAELAAHLGISEAATRRHVDRLAGDELVDSTTVNTGVGRPVARWSLTDRGRRLFPARYDEVARDLLAFLASEDRATLGAFLRWRQEQQVAEYGDRVDADDVRGRLEQLARALTADGYGAVVDADGDGLTLRQQHCAIETVARDHPLLCAHEAAAFGRLLGEDVSVSRRETIANGDGACVCHVQVRTPDVTTLPVIPVSSATTSCCAPDTPTTEEDAT